MVSLNIRSKIWWQTLSVMCINKDNLFFSNKVIVPTNKQNQYTSETINIKQTNKFRHFK